MASFVRNCIVLLFYFERLLLLTEFKLLNLSGLDRRRLRDYLLAFLALLYDFWVFLIIYLKLFSCIEIIISLSSLSYFHRNYLIIFISYTQGFSYDRTESICNVFGLDSKDQVGRLLFLKRFTGFIKVLLSLPWRLLIWFLFLFYSTFFNLKVNAVTNFFFENSIIFICDDVWLFYLDVLAFS